MDNDEQATELCGPDLAFKMPKLALVAQRALNVCPSDNSQREQLYYSRDVMGDLILSVVIDFGSCANFISQKVV